MGRYIQTPLAKGKALHIASELGERCARNIPPSVAEKIVRAENGEIAVVCVVDNGPFEAAGYCYSESEFLAFCSPGDPRPREFLAVPKEWAEQNSTPLTDESF